MWTIVDVVWSFSRTMSPVYVETLKLKTMFKLVKLAKFVMSYFFYRKG